MARRKKTKTKAKVRSIKPKIKEVKKKKIVVYYATYTGRHKGIGLPGIGKFCAGKEVKVRNKEIYDTLEKDPNFITRMGFVYK